MLRYLALVYAAPLCVFWLIVPVGFALTECSIAWMPPKVSNVDAVVPLFVYTVRRFVYLWPLPFGGVDSYNF